MRAPSDTYAVPRRVAAATELDPTPPSLHACENAGCRRRAGHRCIIVPRSIEQLLSLLALMVR